MTPQAAPRRNEVIVRSAIRKDMPTPRVVSMTEEMAIALADGKATRRTRL